MDAKNVSNIMRDLSRGPWTFVFIGCGQVSRRGVVENFKVIHNKISFIRNIFNINTNKSTHNCCFWSTCVMKFQLSYKKLSAVILNSVRERSILTLKISHKVKCKKIFKVGVFGNPRVLFKRRFSNWRTKDNRNRHNGYYHYYRYCIFVKTKLPPYARFAANGFFDKKNCIVNCVLILIQSQIDQLLHIF